MTSLAIFLFEFQIPETTKNRVPAALCVRVVAIVRPSKHRGRREVPGARCTRGLVCRGRGWNAHEYTGSPEHPALPAQWSYGLFRALPGERLFCLRRQRDTSRRLDASTAASGPHDFAVRNQRLRPAHLCVPDAACVHRIPSRVRDDRDTPLSRVGRHIYRPDLGFGKTEIFFQKGLDSHVRHVAN